MGKDAKSNRSGPAEHPTLIKIDPFKSEVGQKGLHNRWQWVCSGIC